jgi:peptidoglycan lytic transglycosylase G
MLLIGALLSCGGPPPDTEKIIVTIPRGASLESAVDSLAARGVVGSPWLFGIYARVRGLGSGLKSGVYGFRAGESWADLVDALRKGRGALARFAVPEGLMLTEVADYARIQLGVPRDSFLAAARDTAVIAKLGLAPGTPSAEGFLYPTTYLVRFHPDARELVRVMTDRFLAYWTPEWQARLDTLRMSRVQAVTLASIIQSEVRYSPDRAYVSAVYHNRLRRGMRLEADPTVIYAYGHRLKRVFEKNLLVRSPYNTYLHTGLPPGPISQPDTASLRAALYPAAVPYLYFVAQPDGKHIFSVTYAEHQAAIQAARRMRSAARAPRPPGR